MTFDPGQTELAAPAGSAERSSGRARESSTTLTPGLALLPLRAFLGVTFVYAGVQKLSDPGFLHPGAPTYIGTQLHNFANGTPGGFLLRAFAIPHPKLAGVAVALIEIAIGLLVLAGLLTRAAAAVGLVLNLVLFLTNSWKTTPYFLGSDIVFVFAWLPFVLVGASGQPALDNALDRLTARRVARFGGRAGPARPDPVTAPGWQRTRPAQPEAVTRRVALGQALGATAVATLVLGGLAALAKGRYRSATRTLGARPAHPSGGESATTHHNPSAAASPPAGAVKLGPANQLPPGQAAGYTDPGDREPDIVIRQSDGSLTAFSAVCTHAGCTVGYQNGQIVCPCHGGTYNARTGAVEGGPPPAPLSVRHVVEQGGQIYAVPA